MSGENLAPIVALAHGLKAVSVPMPIWYDVAITASRVKKELEGDVTTTADAGDKILRVTSMSPRLSLGIPGLRGKDGEFADELYKRWVGYVSAFPLHVHPPSLQSMHPAIVAPSTRYSSQ